MNSSPRIPPRFLPTLTEIVQAPPATQPDANAVAREQTEVEGGPARGLDPLIEQQVRELVRALVAEQLDSLQAAWREQRGESDDK
jgi:hypothetical protein